MAHKKEVIARAKDLYCLQGKTIKEITAVMGIPGKTIANWKDKDEWDKQIATGSAMETFLQLYKAFNSKVLEVIENGTINNAPVADALLKNKKLLDQLMPGHVILGNMYRYLEDTTNYIADHGDDRMKEWWQEHIEVLGEVLRKKYAGNMA
jgi:hypothetical protein